jgi:hypothetical protein
MWNSTIPSLTNLPIEIIYRIFDHLDSSELLISVRDVCTQLDQITETYHRYQVIQFHNHKCKGPF